MKTLRATTPCITLLCLILIEQNFAEQTAHHNVVSHHRDTQKKHHYAPPGGIQTPHQEQSTSKVSCISADSNIYEIFHKANANCKGNDMRCTFYHYSDHKYHNLGTIDVDKDLFDTLLAKYDNWLITPEPIKEKNNEDSNHNFKFKDYEKNFNTEDYINTGNHEYRSDTLNRNNYDNNVIQDTFKLGEFNNILNDDGDNESHYRRHKAKLTSDQKARFKNGELVSVDPKFNDKQKYYELFIPKGRHRGDPRTIFVDVDVNKSKHVLFDENLTNKRMLNNDKPIEVKLQEFSTNEEEEFDIYDKHRKDIYHHRLNDNGIARTQGNNDIEVKESSKNYLNPSYSKPSVINFNYNNPSADLDSKLGNNDKTLTASYNKDVGIRDDDDESHLIHLVETNAHHNDWNADDFTYKRSDTIHLNEPVFRVEKPLKQNNTHVFSLPDYTGHHSEGISDYTGYNDSNLNDVQDLHTPSSAYDISSPLPDKPASLRKESPTSLLKPVKDQAFPGHVGYYNPKGSTYNTPYSSQDIGLSPASSSSLESAVIPNLRSEFSPYNVDLRSSPSSSRMSETLLPCDFNPLSQGTFSSLPDLYLPTQEYSKSTLLPLSREPSQLYEASNSFKRPSVSPETTFFTYPCPLDDIASSHVDASSSLFGGMSSNSPTAAMHYPMTANLGPETHQYLQMPHSSPYSQLSKPNVMNLGLANHLQQSNNFGKPSYNQNNMLLQPSRNIFNTNPYTSRPQFSQPFNPMASYLPAPGISPMNSSPLSAYSSSSLLHGNRIPDSASNAFLPHPLGNLISPLSLMSQRPNYITNVSPCSNPVNMPTLIQDNLLNKYHEIADNLALNANLQHGILDSLSPLQNIPLSVLEHPYIMTSSNYIRPTQSDICSSTMLNDSQKGRIETSSYSELAHLNEKPYLMLDSSLIDEHLPKLTPIKPFNDETFNADIPELIPLDASLIGSELDTNLIQTNAEEPPSVDYLDIHESNLILDSNLTEPSAEIVSSNDLADNKTSITITTSVNIESEAEPSSAVVDSSLIGEHLPISSSDDAIVLNEIANFTEGLNEDLNLTDLIPLELYHVDTETDISQLENITHEIFTESNTEYLDTDASITSLPSNLTGKGLDVKPNVTYLEPLDSSLTDSELSYVQKHVDHEIVPHTSLDNLHNITEYDHNVLQSSILPSSLLETENPQLLDATLDTHVSININESIPEILDSELTGEEMTFTDTEKVEESITTNAKIEFDDKIIPTKANTTIHELEAEEFIPAITSGMNIHTEIEDIHTADLLPVNELNSSLVEPSLQEITDANVNLTSDLIGPTILNGTQTSEEISYSNSTEFESSLVDSTLGGPTVPHGKETIEVSEHLDIVETLDPSIITESKPVLASGSVASLEDSLVGPSIIIENNTLENTPVLDSENVLDSTLVGEHLPKEDEFQEITPISETSIKIETNITVHNESFENITVLKPNTDLESSLVDPSVDQIINAEIVNNVNTKPNLTSNLVGPSLVKDINELELIPVSDTTLTGPNLVNANDLVEEPVLDFEAQLDDSLIGPDLTRSGQLNEEKRGLGQTEPVLLDSSLIDTLLDSEKRLNGPNSSVLPSSIVSTEILPSNYRRDGVPSESSFSPICERPNDIISYLPEDESFPHDLTSPALSEILHQSAPANTYRDVSYTPFSNSYIPQEVTPVSPNSFIKESNPFVSNTKFPAMPFKNSPQYSVPCENLFAPSGLNFPSNVLPQQSLPLYANAIPYSPSSSLLSKHSPLHNIPNTPFSRSYIKPEYLQSYKNPLVLNALLNNAHLINDISPYTHLQEQLMIPEHISHKHMEYPRPPKDRNLQAIANNYLQALKEMPNNLQQLKSNIPCFVPTVNPLSLTEISPALNNQNIQSMLRPTENQISVPNTNHFIDTVSQKYHNMESELNSFILEAENNPQLLDKLEGVLEENYELLEDTCLSSPEEGNKYDMLTEDEVQEYISEATSFAKPLHVAKKLPHNLQEADFIKVKPELYLPTNEATEFTKGRPHKYKPKNKPPAYFEPVIEEYIPNEHQIPKPSNYAQIVEHTKTHEKAPMKSSTEQYYSHPYEMLSEPITLSRPTSSPLSYSEAKPELLNSPYFSPHVTPPCLQEYTSLPASENMLATDHLRPVPAGKPYRPSQTHTNPYLTIHSSPPLFESSVSMESSYQPISPSFSQPTSKELSMRPLSSTPLSSTAELISPSYYSPISTPYSDYPFTNPAGILAEPSSPLSGISPNEMIPMNGLPCLKPLSLTNPILKELMSNPQFMKAMNMQPIANNIYPCTKTNGKLPTSPFMLQTPNHPIKSIPYETVPINVENIKENELSEAIKELNSQKLKTATADVWTTYDEENTYTYSNDKDKKIHEDIIPESCLETVPYTLEPEKNTKLVVNKDYDDNNNYSYSNDRVTKIHEDLIPESQLEFVPYTLESEDKLVEEIPITSYATKPKLNQGRPTSFSQTKEAYSHPPIVETVPHLPDMQWLPQPSQAPCPKLSPFIPAFNQNPNLRPIPHLPSFLPSPMNNRVLNPCKNIQDYYPFLSSPYYPAIVTENSGIPMIAPSKNNTPLLPVNSHVLENLIPLEAAGYSPFGLNSIPTSHLPSQLSNTPFHNLPLEPLDLEQFKNVSPMTTGVPLREYMPQKSPPSILMNPISSPLTARIQNGRNVPVHEEIFYEPYSKLPEVGTPKYPNIIEHLPPIQEAPIYYEPAPSSSGPSKSPKKSNIIENLPSTLLPCSEKIISPDTNKISSNYESYTSPFDMLEESIETTPCLPCRPLMKPIFSQNLMKPEDEYTILSPSSLEASSSYTTEPLSSGQYISKPSPKLQPDLSKFNVLLDQPYTPTNKVQTPSNIEYISDTSPLLKLLSATPFTPYNSIPFGANAKLPYYPPNYLNLRPINYVHPSPPTLINPFIKDIITPAKPIEGKILSPATEPSDNIEEYFEPCPSSEILTTPLQSLPLEKPLTMSLKAPPITSQEMPAELPTILSPNVLQYISSNSPLLRPLLSNAYNPSLYVPQRLTPPEIDLSNLSKYKPIICNIDETVTPKAPISTNKAPCELYNASLFSPYQSSIPTGEILSGPMSLTPSKSMESPLLTSPYQEIPSEVIQPISMLPSFSPIFTPSYRPTKLTPITMQYGPKSIVENAPEIENICESELPTYSEPSPTYPMKNNGKSIKQIELEGFPISELFSKAPNILPFEPCILPSNEVPKTPTKQNSLPNEPMPWVLIDNENIPGDENADIDSAPCEYISETIENPIEAEFLKLAKLLSDAKKHETEFENYTEVSEENEYEELPSNLEENYTILDDIASENHIPKNVFKKSEHIAEPENFYVNDHTGESPEICYTDPTRTTTPRKPLIDAKQPDEKALDITTNFEEIPNINTDIDSELDTQFFTPEEYLRAVPSTTDGANYITRPALNPAQKKYLPKPMEHLPENEYYNPSKDNLENIEYSGYKTYQIPTRKLAEKASLPPVPQTPIFAPKPYSYIPTMDLETETPEYQTETPPQPKLDLRVQPQSPNFNNYIPIDETPANADNLVGDNEIKNSVINYINNKGLKDKLYNNKEELTIPIGNIVITKKEPHTARIIQTGNPLIGLKVWKSNVKLVEAELKLKLNEVSVYNFMPIINNLNKFDIQEIRKIIKSYIDEKYGEHIEVNEPYTVDNQYTVIKDLNRNVENNKFNLLWPTYYL